MGRAAAERGPRPEHVELLRARAAALARTETTRENANPLFVVVFTLAGERYALDARVVREVSTLSNLLPLPGAAAPRFGVTHWRGSALMIFDLRPTLNLDTRRLTDLARVLVIEGSNYPFGVLADAVHDVIPIDRADVRPLQREEAAAQGALVSGLTEDQALLIDPEALLRWAAPGEPIPER